MLSSSRGRVRHQWSNIGGPRLAGEIDFYLVNTLAKSLSLTSLPAYLPVLSNAPSMNFMESSIGSIRIIAAKRD